MKTKVMLMLIVATQCSIVPFDSTSAQKKGGENFIFIIIVNGLKPDR